MKELVGCHSRTENCVENQPKETWEVCSRREEKQIRIGKINNASRWEPVWVGAMPEKNEETKE